jgi:hypothetical protein
MYVNLADADALANTTNFQIFMMIMNEKTMADKKENVKKVLTLIFPSYNFNFTPRSILINSLDGSFIIDEDNFQEL